MPGANDLLDYWVDAWQRSILMLDVLRQRGNNSIEHNARKAPNVLSFEAELVLDGRSLPRSMNAAYSRFELVGHAGSKLNRITRQQGAEGTLRACISSCSRSARSPPRLTRESVLADVLKSTVLTLQ